MSSSAISKIFATKETELIFFDNKMVHYAFILLTAQFRLNTRQKYQAEMNVLEIIALYLQTVIE